MDFYPPGSVTRRVIGDPAALVGGISALFLQALHPRAMAGVDQHSSFPDDFWPRLRRTVEYVTTLAFADDATAREAAHRVREIHAHVVGVDMISGSPYAADDPDLLRWVHVCEVSSFAGAVRRVGAISMAEVDEFLVEQVRAGELLGATDLPTSAIAVDAYFNEIAPELVASPLARQAARRLLLPPLPLRVELLTPARLGWATVAAVAVGLLPDWAKSMYGIPVLPGSGVVTTVALHAVRGALYGVRAVRGTGPPT